MLQNPQEAERAGIVFIHRELNVLFDLTVEENLFMGKEIKINLGCAIKKLCGKKRQKRWNVLG